jgi:hypothetical protein
MNSPECVPDAGEKNLETLTSLKSLKYKGKEEEYIYCIQQSTDMM